MPRWVRACLAAQAIVQWSLCVVLKWFLPEGWTTVFGVPLAVVGPLALGAAGVFTIAATLAWAFPENQLMVKGYKALQKLRQRRISLGLPILCLAPAFYCFLFDWPGYILVGVQCLLIALLLYLADPVTWATQDNRDLLVVASGLVVLLGLGLRLWLMFVDWVWIDEGIYLSAAAGILRGQGIVPVMFHLPEDIYLRPPWGYAVGLYGLWAKIVGVGLIQGRSLSYLIGLLGLPFIYATSRLWYGERTAWVTTGISALSILFLHNITARSDALPMVAASLTLFLHVYAYQKGSLALHFGVGLLAVLGLEAHLTNLVFLLAFGGYYAVDAIDQIRRGRKQWLAAPLWFFLAGAVLGLLLYVYLHIWTLPYPERYFRAIGVVSSTENFIPERITIAVNRFRGFWVTSPPESLLIIAATVAALVRRTQADKHWLLLMLFTQLGYIAVEYNGNIHYLTYGLSIFLGSIGALVTFGLDKEEHPGSLRSRLTYIGVVLLLAAHNIATIRQRSMDRLYWDDLRRPVTDYIRENVPTDSAIIAPSVYYPYLVAHQNFLLADTADTEIGPALAGVPPEAYWQDVLLDVWPVARIDVTSPFPEVQIYDSYMAARHAQEVVPTLWVVADGGLITDADYADTDVETDLQMVAHVWLPSSVEPGDTLQLGTLWTTRQAVTQDYFATLSLTTSQSEIVAQADQQLISGWADTPTSEWPANQFHDVAFELTIPNDLPPGTYMLHLVLYAQPDTRSGHEGTSFIIDQMTVAP